MADPHLSIALPITTEREPSSAAKRPGEYGFLLLLTAFALVSWLFTRFFSWGRASKPVLIKKAQELQREIATLEILQEQARHDLRRVRLEQKSLQTEKDRQKANGTTHPLSTDFPLTENGR